MPVEKISLYYKDGGSDKVYHTQIEPKDSGYVVNFQYGRRGQTLQTGTKTANPVPLDKAKKIFDKLVAEKKGKGYTEGEDGTPFQGSDKAGDVSGLIPQLLNPISHIEAMNLVQNSEWFMQEKKDGVRCMVRVTTNGEVIGSNRKGLITPLPGPTESNIRSLLIGNNDVMRDAVLDGELIGEVYHVFDLLEIDGQNLRECAAQDRYDRLAGMFGDDDDDPFVKLVVAFMTNSVKEAQYTRLREKRAEGVVFKKKSSKYVSGRPNSGGNQLKDKFKASATVEIVGTKEGKRSVAIAVRQDSQVVPGEFVKVGVGFVTIPANHSIPKIGQLVEVEYLYAYPQGALFQAVYKGPRPDQDRPDTYESLKFKAGTTDEDDDA